MTKPSTIQVSDVEKRFIEYIDEWFTAGDHYDFAGIDIEDMTNLLRYIKTGDRALLDMDFIPYGN